MVATVRLRRAEMERHAGLVAYTASRMAKWQARDFAAVLAAESSGAGNAVVAEHAGAGQRFAAEARSLTAAAATATTNTTVATTGIRAVPEIVAGLLVSLLLIIITAVGVSCTMAVATPDMMHAGVLPAGKEY